MNTTAYSFIRVLGRIHLYAGLFISPFVVIYAVTAIMFNHRLGTDPDAYEVTGRKAGMRVTVDNSLENLQLAQDLMRQFGLHGEIDNVFRNDKSVNIPVSRPGETDIVRVDLVNSTADIEHRKTGIAGALIYLHSRPGPHVVAIRGNWFWIKVWRVLADLTVYVLLVLTISGPVVWLALKQKTRVGLVVVVFSLAVIALLLIVMRG